MSRRIAFILLVVAVTLSACSGLPQISAGDSQATSVAGARTAAALTLMAQPTMTLPPSNTPLPAFTHTVAPSATPGPTQTASPAPDAIGTASASATSTLAGAASGATSSPTATGTLSGTATITPSPTLGPLLFGTIPPEVPYGYVTLVNLSNRMVYISFHCTLENGQLSYLEYPVYDHVKVKIPVGPCHYVAVIKGEPFSGDIHIKKFVEYTFTFRRKVFITQP